MTGFSDDVDKHPGSTPTANFLLELHA